MGPTILAPTVPLLTAGVSAQRLSPPGTLIDSLSLSPPQLTDIQ